MAEARRSLPCLSFLLLFAGGSAVPATDLLSSLAPPVHLSGPRLGWTLLVCMVSDFQRGRLKVSWISASQGLVSSSTYRASVSRSQRGRSAVAAVTVATRDWPSYRCSVGQRRAVSSTGKQEEKWLPEDKLEGLTVWTNTVMVVFLRLLLIKSVTFNTLMTLSVVLRARMETQFDFASFTGAEEGRLLSFGCGELREKRNCDTEGLRGSGTTDNTDRKCKRCFKKPKTTPNSHKTRANIHTTTTKDSQRC